MKYRLSAPFAVDLARTVAVGLLAAWLPWQAAAQSFCTSDGQPRPAQLLERFINADCATCWADPAKPQPSKGTVVLDWIVPGSLGDEAPLSAAASRDALARLESLKRPLPAQSSQLVTPVIGLRGTVLRVAHGLPVSDYLGVSIGLKPVPAHARSWSAWLALVETVPAGTEGSPVERNLVRNLLFRKLDEPRQLSKKEQLRFFESRSMYIAPSVKSERLRLIGWVEDSHRRVVAASESRCAVP